MKGAGPLGTSRSVMVAGLLDTGLASVATFVVGVTAVQLLTDAGFGAYSLFFLAFNLLALIPTALILGPLRLDLLTLEAEHRTLSLARHIRWGTGGSVFAVIALAAVIPMASSDDISRSTLLALWATAAATAVLSPLQDHVRRVFHLAGLSSLAAATSAIQLMGVAGALGVALAIDIDDAWIPLGVLATANLVSLNAGMALAARANRRISHPRPAQPRRGIRSVLSEGWWLLTQGALPPASGFLGGLVVSRLVGLDALGQASAARIVAQPLFVIAGGLGSSMGPRSMEAGAERDLAKARRIRRTFNWTLGTIGVAYVGYAIIDGRINVMRTMVPLAYSLSGLVLLTSIAAIIDGQSYPRRSELMGARRLKPLTAVDAAALLSGFVTTVATAIPLGAFAPAVGALAAGTVRLGGRVVISNRLYRRAGDRLQEVHAENPPDPHPLPLSRR